MDSLNLEAIIGICLGAGILCIAVVFGLRPPLTVRAASSGGTPLLAAARWPRARRPE